MLKINCQESVRASWILETAKSWFQNQTSPDINVTVIDDDQLLKNYKCHKLTLSAFLDNEIPISVMQDSDNIILTNVSSAEFDQYLNSAFEFITKENHQRRDIDNEFDEVITGEWDLNEHEPELENLEIPADVLNINLKVKEEIVLKEEKDPFEEQKVVTEVVVRAKKKAKKSKYKKREQLKKEKETEYQTHSVEKEKEKSDTKIKPKSKEKQCRFCDYKTVNCVALKEHERTHTGEKPEICNFCQKGFSHRKTLETHKRTHTGEKPYKCKFCDSCFSQRNSVDCHVKAHHKEFIGDNKEKVFILDK